MNTPLYDIIKQATGLAVDGPFHSYTAAAAQADLMNRNEIAAGGVARYTAKARQEFSRESVRVWDES